MLKRNAIVGSLLVLATLVLVAPMSADSGSLLPATSTRSVLPVMPLAACLQSVPAVPERAQGASPVPLGTSCADQCRELYYDCLDDCDAWPFPGCYDYCRFDVLYPCYQSCF